MKRSPNYSPYEFTRAAYDEVKDAEKQLHVRFETVLVPTLQKGVWELDTCVFDTLADPRARYFCRQRDSWPNSQVMSFEAMLYQHAHKVVRMAENYRADRERELLRQQGG